jgi:hypothetical protein
MKDGCNVYPLFDSQSTCCIAADKNLSAKASNFLSGQCLPHLTSPFSQLPGHRMEEERKLIVSFPVGGATPHLPLSVTWVLSLHSGLKRYSSYHSVCFSISIFIQFNSETVTYMIGTVCEV